MNKISACILLLLFCKTHPAAAQKIDSIYVHLYTDSLKKGTYNYINIDGLLSNGKYIPLDSTQLSFRASHGNFFGNNLFIEADSKAEKVSVFVEVKADRSLRKEFVIYIKKLPDGKLKTERELMEELRQQHKKP